MSNVRDRGVIDIVVEEGDRHVLVILDDMEWDFGTRQQHGRILQDKINDYLNYIASGQAEQAKPGLRPVIRILAQHSYSRYCIDFLERVRAFIKGKDDICDIEWTHSAEDGPFEDGFSDDFVFDEKKVYPRLKKNWAKDPLQEVAMTAPYQSSPNYPDNMVMIRFMDSYIITFVQDVGSMFTYITYDMMPEGTDVMQLQKTAFENLGRDVSYRSCASREEGISGIIAGGDFEAESLCFSSIWKELSDDLQDDVIVCVPTKDIVFYTKANDRKLVKKMLKMAGEMYAGNQVETPHLLFSRDVFIYSRADGTLQISRKYSF